MAAATLPKAWEEMLLPTPYVETVFERLGMENALRGNFVEGIKYFDDVTGQNDKRKTTLHERSKCYSEIAAVNEAYKDAVAACDIVPTRIYDDLRLCDALYDLNDFEHFNIELAVRSRKHCGVKLQQFSKRIDIVNKNFSDMIGENAGNCLLNQRYYIQAASNSLQKEDEYYMPRPIWKKLREDNKCDVLSTRPKEEENRSRRELARRQLNYRIYMQTYYHVGWKDAAFIKDLANHEAFLLQQTPKSTKKLKDFVTKEKPRINTFAKMLNARCPLYTKSRLAFANADKTKDASEKHLYLVQYQTRRDSFNVLKKCNELRETGNIRKLVNFVEGQMSNYFSVKTSRVMPRKFEFLNELYNVVALAYCDKFKIPKNLEELPLNEQLYALVSVEMEHMDETDAEIDPLEFIDQNQPDYAYLTYKKKMNHYESRIEYTEYPIERSYIYHEIAKLHLTQSKVDDARSLGNKALAEAQLCGHFLYMLLAVMAKIEANVIQQNFGKLSESLKLALEIAPNLKNPEIIKYLNKISEVNQAMSNKRKASMMHRN